MPGPRGGRRRSPPPCPPVRSRRLPFSRRRGSRLRARLHPLTRRGPGRDCSDACARRWTICREGCAATVLVEPRMRTMRQSVSGVRTGVPSVGRCRTGSRAPAGGERTSATRATQRSRVAALAGTTSRWPPRASRAEAEQPRYATSGPRRIGARPFGTRTQMRVPRLRADTTSTAPPSRPISSRTLMSPKPV